MRPPPWRRDFVGDNESMTRRLTPVELGAYMRLIWSYWQLGPPEDDDEMLARITGTQIREWKKIRPAVQKFFEVADGFWNCQKLNEEKAEAHSCIEKTINKTKAAREAKAKQKCF